MAEPSYTPLALPHVAALNLPSLSNLSFHWTKIDSSPSGAPLRRGPTSIALGDKVYIFGGSLEQSATADIKRDCARKILVFDTKESRWEAPVECEELVIGSGSVNHVFQEGNSIMCQLSDNLCLVDPKTGNLDFLRDRFSARSGASTRTSSGDMIVWNGKDATVRYNCKTWEKEPAVDNFGDIPYEEHSPHLFSVGGNVVFYREKQSAIYIHSPLGGQWASFPTSKAPPRPAAIGFGVHRYGPLIIVTCGWWGNQYSVITLNLITGLWTDHGVLPGAPQHDGVPAPALVGNKILFWGAEKTDSIHVLHIENLGWSDEQFSKFDSAFDLDLSNVLHQIQKPREIVDDFVEDDTDLSRRDILTNPKLKPFQADKMKIHRKIEQSVPGLFEATPVALPRFLKHNLPTEEKGNGPPPNHVFHKNMISYLVLAYDAHLSVILTPDMVFYTLLCELADLIKSQPEMYSHIFTKTPGEKSTTFFFQKDPTEIDLDDVCDRLQASMPSDASAFRASFTTTDPASRLAMNAAFADGMGCYTFYVGGLCGIPRVRVLGSKADWQQIEEKLEKWIVLFKSSESNTSKENQGDFPLRWMQSARDCIRDIYTKRDPAFWKEMMEVDRCNCGTTDAITGWISRLYRCCRASKRYGKVNYYTKDFYNFESHISAVTWANQETLHEYSLFTGLLYSTIEAPQTDLDATFPFLKPHFAHLIRDETDMSMTPEDYTRYLSTLPWEDAHFLRAHREYMDAPVVLRGGSEKVRHMHAIIMQKWLKLNEAASRGACQSVEFSLPSFDQSFGRLKLPDDSGVNRDNEKLRSEIDAKYPLLRRIAEEIGKFVGSGPIASMSLSNEHHMMCFSDIFLQNIGQSQVKKLVLDVRSLDLIHQVLAVSPRSLAELEIEFPCPLDASDLNKPLIACASPLTSIKIKNCSNLPLEAIRSRLTHALHPLDRFELQLRSEDRTSLYNFIADNSSSIRLRHLRIDLDSAAGFAQASALARFFSQNSYVESISVSLGAPDAETKRVLIDGISQAPIKKIEARYTAVDPFASLIDRLPLLEEINFVELTAAQGTGLVAAFASAVSNLLRSPTCRLSQLTLHRCNLGDKQIAEIMDAISLGNAKLLWKVILDRNTVGATASSAIARALASPTCAIEELRLYECAIPSQGGIEIVSALEHNTALSHIAWGGSKPKSPVELCQMMQALGRTLAKNATVQSINGPLGVADEDTMRSLAAQIADNNSIQTLAFDRYSGTRSQLESVWFILRRNRKLASKDDYSDLIAYGDNNNDSDFSDDSSKDSDDEGDDADEE